MYQVYGGLYHSVRGHICILEDVYFDVGGSGGRMGLCSVLGCS